MINQWSLEWPRLTESHQLVKLLQLSQEATVDEVLRIPADLERAAKSLSTQVGLLVGGSPRLGKSMPQDNLGRILCLNTSKQKKIVTSMSLDISHMRHIISYASHNRSVVQDRRHMERWVEKVKDLEVPRADAKSCRVGHQECTNCRNSHRIESI